MYRSRCPGDHAGRHFRRALPADIARVHEDHRCRAAPKLNLVRLGRRTGDGMLRIAQDQRGAAVRRHDLPEFIRKSRIAAPASQVFVWHELPDAFARLTPPWEAARVVELPATLGGESRAVILVGHWPLRVRWVAEHRDLRRYEEGGGEFTDVQVKGPFRSWSHRHIVTADGPGACTLTDHIRYELPLGLLGRLVGGPLVRRKLERMFDYRHRVTREENEGKAMPPRDGSSA
jgi:ligand-binding SRPBCC domain-containing protein